MTYIDGEELPQEYVPFNVRLGNGELLATVDSKKSMHYICYDDDGIQRISFLPDGDTYLLGPGPDFFSLKELIESQVEELKESSKEATSGNSLNRS